MLALFFGVSIPLSLFVNYAVTFLEIAWSFSMFLAIFADIPQFYLTLTSGILDWEMILYLVMISAYRLFYLPHWVIRCVFYSINACEMRLMFFRYAVQNQMDPIAAASGICTVSVHLVAYIFIVSKKVAQAPEMQLEDHLIIEDANPKKVEILFDE